MGISTETSTDLKTNSPIVNYKKKERFMKHQQVDGVGTTCQLASIFQRFLHKIMTGLHQSSEVA